MLNQKFLLEIYLVEIAKSTIQFCIKRNQIMKTDKSQPLVTIYMPTYNRVELLRRAVGSVLEQDYRNIELIVVDDNSTDGTHEYLAKMANEDPRFKYFINEKNSGACVSRNKAIFAANGEFITGLDDDDYFLPHHVSSLIDKWYERSSNCVAIYSNCYIKSPKGIIKSPSKIKQCYAKSLVCQNWIGNQILTKTIYLKNIRGFDVSFPAWQDLECWYRLLSSYNMKAECNNKYSYVVDIDHPHERITTGKVGKVEEAHQLFCNKYNLNHNQREILSMQLLHYTQQPATLKSIIQSTLYLPTKYNIDRSLRLMVNIVKKKVARQ